MYKYRLREQDESSPKDYDFREKTDLFLSSKNDKYPLDYILNILKNPKPSDIKGLFIPHSESGKEIIQNTYGYPAILANTSKNAKLKQEQIEKYGTMFYKHVENITNEKFTQFKSNGFPEHTKTNNNIINQYVKLIKDKSKILTGLKWEEVADEEAVKFLTDNISMAEKMVKAILTNAGLKYNEDYSLTRKKINENIEKPINKEVFNIEPQLAFKIYNILKKDYSSISQDFTESAFFFYLNKNL